MQHTLHSMQEHLGTDRKHQLKCGENIRKKWKQTYPFSDRQIWPYDFFRIHQKYITDVEVICRDINTAQFLISIISLNQTPIDQMIRRPYALYQLCCKIREIQHRKIR